MSIKISELGNLTSFTDETLVAVVNTAATYTTVKANGAVLKTYVLGSVDANIAALQANAVTQQQHIWYSNVGMKGYVDNKTSSYATVVYVNGQITAANAGVTAANLAMKGYVDSKVLTANVGMKGYVDNVTTAWTANAYQQEQDIANLRTQVNSLTPPYYGDANVAIYLPTHTGNVGGKVTTASQQYITSLGNLTTLTVAGNATITGNAFAATPAAGANSTQIATTAYVQRPGWNSQGRKTISSNPPAGGSDGDIWYQV